MRRLAAVTLLVAQALTGCTSWRVQTVGPRELIEARRPDAVRVRDTSGSVFVVRSPYLVNDSLRGLTGGAPAAVSLAAIDRLAVRRFNFFKTVGWWVIAPVIAMVAAVALSCAGGCNFGY
jgi:hypothetical protein